MKTVLLDRTTWDLVLDSSGNIAAASDPYSKAQDASSAVRLFEGELYYDTGLGVPYFQQILGKSPPLSYMRQKFVEAAMRVPGVVSAAAFISAIAERRVRGQVQVTDREGRTLGARF